MRFRDTSIPGVVVVDLERRVDERGFFARTFSEALFAERGLPTRFPECSLAFNERKGTIRGLHMQAAPHQEAKLVRCTSGAIFDVALDLRVGSSTFGRWFAEELSADNRRMLFVPEGCAHGYQTLVDSTEVSYQITTSYRPASASGVRWDDPQVGIPWPEEPTSISERDRNLPALAEAL